jgi:hypothetical protein
MSANVQKDEFTGQFNGFAVPSDPGASTFSSAFSTACQKYSLEITIATCVNGFGSPFNSKVTFDPRASART